MINYSIIIPHRNTPDLLQRCIDSIPRRDDLQVIVIDDNSSPEIVNFNSFPGRNIAYITCIFDKSNRGAGHARNLGLEQAKGNWLVFADADDYFTEDFNKVLDKYANSHADMVFFNAVSVNENGQTGKLALNRYISNTLKHAPYSSSVLKYGVWSPWSRMVKRIIIEENSIKFEEVPVGNDTMFVLTATSRIKSFEVESDIVYNYYQPTLGSQTYAKYNNNTILSRLEQKFKINKLYTTVGYPFKWPIERPFSKSELKGTPEYNAILKENEYSKFMDLFVFIKYIFAKLFRIL